MIPTKETERLVVATITATTLARSGQKQVGYDWLRAGLAHAQDYERQGLVWAPRLVERWKQVLAAYCAELDFQPSAELEEAAASV